jgi:acyl-CoA reductase-like NAD-dependent aldehyde dehydrogenase
VILANVPDMNGDDAKLAVSAAHSAFTNGIWPTFDVRSRSSLLSKFASTIRDNKQLLAELITMENGKPIPDALLEIEFSAQYFDVSGDVCG